MVYDVGLSTSSQVRTKFMCISLVFRAFLWFGIRISVFGWEDGF
jgi:hypothetical protein